MPTIRELRERRGWTQEEAAHRVGASLHAYQKWDRGTATPRPGHLRDLARAFGVSLTEIELPPDATRGRQPDARP